MLPGMAFIMYYFAPATAAGRSQQAGGQALSFNYKNVVCHYRMILHVSWTAVVIGIAHSAFFMPASGRWIPAPGGTMRWADHGPARWPPRTGNPRACKTIS